MITVLGLGFVGLTTALGFAEKGFKVFGYEVDQARVSELEAGRVPFHEPGLPEQLAKHLNVNFFIISDLSSGVKESDLVILCVGTPSGDDGAVDLEQLKGAVEAVVDAVDDDKFRVLCVKSTVPPSTTQIEVAGFLRERGKEPGVDIGLANNPEFLREGYAWQDFINPDRLVIGTSDNKSWEIMSRFYEPFNVKVHHVSLNSGEFIKYLSNSLLATMISFANEMSMVAHTMGDVDIQQAFNILHEDKRWFGNPAKMASYAYPGCGFGGYCLPKDTSALVHKAKNFGYDTRLLKSVLSVNNEIRRFLVDRVSQSIKPGARVALLGLSFKPNSDDVRMSPSAWVIEELMKKGVSNIIAFDPIATKSFEKYYSFDVSFAASLEEAVKNAEVIILVTAWPEFKEQKALYQGKQIFDFRYFI